MLGLRRVADSCGPTVLATLLLLIDSAEPPGTEAFLEESALLKQSSVLEETCICEPGASFLGNRLQVNM